MSVEQYTVVANDWVNLEFIINDLVGRVVGQEVHPTSSPTFADIDVTSDLTIGGDLDVTGNLDVTGDISFDGELTLDDLTASRLVATDASKVLTSVAALTTNSLLLGNGTNNIASLGVAANGKIPIGSTGTTPVLAEITGTANQIISTAGAGSITLSTPQDIHTGASPTFAGLTVTNAAVLGANSVVFQPITDSTTFFQVLDADGGTPIFNVDSTNERIGVGEATPEALWHVTSPSASVVYARFTNSTGSGKWDVFQGSGGNALLRGYDNSGAEKVRLDPTSDSYIANGLGIGVSHLSGTTLTLPLENVPSTPTMAFGIGIGFYAPNITTIRVAVNGTHHWNFSTSAFQSQGQHAGLRNENATATVANVHTDGEDFATGIGGVRGTIDLITGGNSGLHVSASQNVSVVSGNLILPKTSGIGVKIDTSSPTFGWRDLRAEVRTRGVGATDPNDTTYIGNVKAYSFAVNDEAWIEFHIPHDYVAGTDIYLHFHWSHNSAIVTGGAITLGADVTYAKGHDQAAFSATVNPILSPNASTTQYQHIVSEVQLSASAPGATQIDTDDLEPDGLILARVYLSANNITSSGAVPDPFIHEVDIHYQSTNIATKQNSPDFYT